MVEYPHFALPNLYLTNGYEETRVGDSVGYTYQESDKLERCVARVLLRRPKRFRGWDFRFLRRELGLSQQQAGKMLQRDAQTVARWEKSRRLVPTFADLLIRSRFAARFESRITVQEVLSYVDGTAPKFPERIFLTFVGGEWIFQLETKLALARIGATSETKAFLPPFPGPVEPVYTLKTIAFRRQSGAARPLVKGTTSKGLVYLQGQLVPYVTLERDDPLEFGAIGNIDERHAKTKH